MILSQLIPDTTVGSVFPWQFQSPWSIIFSYLNRGSIHSRCCPHWCVMATMMVTTRVIAVDPIMQSLVDIPTEVFLETKHLPEHKSNIWCFSKETLFQEMLISKRWLKYSMSIFFRVFLWTLNFTTGCASCLSTNLEVQGSFVLEVSSVTHYTWMAAPEKVSFPLRFSVPSPEIFSFVVCRLTESLACPHIRH